MRHWNPLARRPLFRRRLNCPGSGNRASNGGVCPTCGRPARIVRGNRIGAHPATVLELQRWTQQAAEWSVTQ